MPETPEILKIDSEILTDLADAVRAKNGDTATYTEKQLIKKTKSLPTEIKGFVMVPNEKYADTSTVYYNYSIGYPIVSKVSEVYYNGNIFITPDVYSISSSAFSKLRKAVISDSVSVVDGHTFQKATLLEKIYIPKTCRLGAQEGFSFSGMPFQSCSNLTIYTDAESKPSGWCTKFNQYSASGYITVVYGVTRAEFDAMEAESDG